MSSGSELRSAALISACTLLSRVLGLVRDVLLAALFGNGVVTDAFVLAFLIPNLARRLFGEGALTAAFLPLFTERLEKDGRERAVETLNVVLTALTVVLSALLVLGYAGTLALPGLVRAGAVTGKAADKIGVALPLLWIMLPFLLPVCLTAFLGAALNALRHFAAPALASVVLNAVWIASLYLLCPLFGDVARTPELAIRGAAWGVLIGGVAELILQIPPLLARGVRLRWRWDRGHGDLRILAERFLPMALGLAVVQVNVLVDQLIAYFLVDEGANTALYLANRIMEFPLALVGISLATAVFPVFASLAARDDLAGFGDLLRRSLRDGLFIAVPASVGAAVLARPLTDLFFRHGAFGGEASARTAFALVFLGLGVWSYAAGHVVTRAYFALKDTRTPVRIAVRMVFLNLALNLALVVPMREAGLALATALCSVVNLALLLRGLEGRIPGAGVRALLAPLGAPVLLSAVMAAAVWLFLGWLPSPPDGGTVAFRLGRVAMPVIGGAGVYFALALAAGLDAPRELLRAVLRRR